MDGGVELITDNEKESEKAKSVFQNADTLFCLDLMILRGEMELKII
jgi:hypothetical protein